MNPSLSFLFLVVVITSTPTSKDYGIVNWNCGSDVTRKSYDAPTTVHALRYADIDVIAALGDSLTAANGAGAATAIDVLKQYRGLAFQIGGDKALEEHISIPNILKKFNPFIFGYSMGVGSADNWQVSKLNQAVPGAQSADMITQATTLVKLMREHPEVNMANDWKLVNIFVGANDMCGYCKGTNSPQLFKQHLINAVQILKENLPRTIVSLTGMLDLSLLRSVDKNKYACDLLHVYECECEKNGQFTNKDMSSASHKYMAAQKEMEDSGMFDNSDDFTFVVQPFFNNIRVPPMLPNGHVDLSWFAPDCFHFSQFGHANVAKHLWNNIVQPVGQKATNVNLTDYSILLQCPQAECPFFRTTKNSKKCANYYHE